MVPHSNKPWFDILSSKYVDGPSIFLAGNPSSVSPSWSYIIQAKNILKDDYSWRVGLGSSSFLHCIRDSDSPLTSGPWLKLSKFASLPLLMAVQLIDLSSGTTTINYPCIILNIDISCLGSPARSGFGGIIRNTFGYYLAGFCGFIQGSLDILYAELYAIYSGILLAINMGINDVVCYSDSPHCINLIKVPHVKYQNHVVLIQDMNELIFQNNVSLCHTLREGNQCVDFFAKFGASLDADFSSHDSPPEGIHDLLRNDAIGTLFLKD
ncbi:hypothetical protein TSUD_319840 [Trifolium subterraneum]|uniref:RNase H type-1 domain-containing protein n=1 Tax=Trifolium subterraneum TaxID=3900 RepID=A0A2Z6NVN7_TRISU|nr:hypothetical protein TSUD_319840 [Trifolium subterraneum]